MSIFYIDVYYSSMLVYQKYSILPCSVCHVSVSAYVFQNSFYSDHGALVSFTVYTKS